MPSFDEIASMYQSSALNLGAPQSDAILMMRSLAINPDTPKAVLEKLASEDNPDITESVAGNSSAPSHVLEKLVQHPDAKVRAALVDNPQITECCLQSLVIDPDPDVRYQLAENPNVPVNILQQLAEDENPYVSYRAKQSLERVESATGENILQQRFGVPQQVRRQQAM